MSEGKARLLTMESPFREQNHTLYLLEPPDSCPESLWERLFASTYDKPFIIDWGVQRRLQFDLYAVQSAMHREHPDRLILAYTRKMMAFIELRSGHAGDDMTAHGITRRGHSASDPNCSAHPPLLRPRPDRTPLRFQSRSGWGC
jgi:hypothetical protein